MEYYTEDGSYQYGKRYGGSAPSPPKEKKSVRLKKLTHEEACDELKRLMQKYEEVS